MTSETDYPEWPVRMDTDTRLDSKKLVDAEARASKTCTLRGPEYSPVATRSLKIRPPKYSPRSGTYDVYMYLDISETIAGYPIGATSSASFFQVNHNFTDILVE